MKPDWTLSPNPCSAGEKLVVGVSGGADSMGLLLFLLENFPGAGKKIIVAHVNYGLRGRESDRDEILVRRFCRTNGLVFKALKIKNFRSLVKKKKKSTQDSAREVRYAFFQKLVLREKAWGVAVAHHLEDQAETVMDRLLRGAGPRGLSGLRTVQILKLNKKDKGLRVWRPLLSRTKEQIKETLRSRQVSWRDDRSNLKNDYRRNQIRNQILPFLGKWNPKISEILARIGEITAAEDLLIEASLESLLRKLKIRVSRKSFYCPASKFENIPFALQRRMVRFAAEKLTDRARGISFERIEEVIRLWRGTEKGPRDIGFGLKAGRKQNRIYLHSFPSH